VTVVIVALGVILIVQDRRITRLESRISGPITPTSVVARSRGSLPRSGPVPLPPEDSPFDSSINAAPSPAKPMSGPPAAPVASTRVLPSPSSGLSPEVPPTPPRVQAWGHKKEDLEDTAAPPPPEVPPVSGKPNS